MTKEQAQELLRLLARIAEAIENLTLESRSIDDLTKAIQGLEVTIDQKM